MHKLLAWWQLLRIGNVFTAASNVIAGFLIAQGGWQPVEPLLVLIAASALLYTAGMVLNDVFDAQLDAVERPERPIPSGRISRGTAAAVGWTLLLLGTACAWFASFLLDSPRLGAVGSVLALCIVGYDLGLKNTPLGPWIMGACRLLNVLLGAYGTSDMRTSGALNYAFVVGVYTVGVTYYARTENHEGHGWNQSIGAAMIIATTFTASFWAGGILGVPEFAAIFFCFLSALIWYDTGWITPGPVASSILQKRVGRMILAFIVMDAILIFSLFAWESNSLGWESAAVILSLLIPTWFASRFAPMT